MENSLKIIKNDPLLEPYAMALQGRHDYAVRKEKELLGRDNRSLSDFASGYLSTLACTKSNATGFCANGHQTPPPSM